MLTHSTPAPGASICPVTVTYKATDMVVAVRCTDETQRQAVMKFAADARFACPADAQARPVYYCNARTHPNGEVLW